MKFYVAAYVGEAERVKAIQRRLVGLGHSLTVDWTDGTADVPDGADRDRHPEKVREIASRDMAGVRDCDAFILLSEPAEGRAKYVELGAAIASFLERGRPQVFVLGAETHQSVFFYHPAVRRVKTLEEVCP